MNDEHAFEATLAWPAAPAQKSPPDPDYSRNNVLGAPGHPPIPGSAPRAYGGDDTRYNPEELLALSLAHCHMLTYLALAAKRRMAVLAYEDRATCVLGKDAATARWKILSAQLRPRVTVARGTNLEEAKALHARAHERCFVASSVNFPVANSPEVIEA